MENDKAEVGRSFSFKLNLGNYQTADFFCSEKCQVEAEKAEAASEALYQFCKNEVIKSVNSYKEELRMQKEEAEKSKRLFQKKQDQAEAETSYEELTDMTAEERSLLAKL